MVKKVLFISLFVLLSSCGQIVYNIKGDCSQVDRSKFFEEVKMSLISNGFNVSIYNPDAGTIYAETEPRYVASTQQDIKYVWKVNISQNGGLVAQAKTVNTSRSINGNAMDGEYYLNDENSDGIEWYWEVREKFDNYCVQPITIEKKEVK